MSWMDQACLNLLLSLHWECCGGQSSSVVAAWLGAGQPGLPLSDQHAGLPALQVSWLMVG